MARAETRWRWAACHRAASTPPPAARRGRGPDARQEHAHAGGVRRRRTHGRKNHRPAPGQRVPCRHTPLDTDLSDQGPIEGALMNVWPHVRRDRAGLMTGADPTARRPVFATRVQRHDGPPVALLGLVVTPFAPRELRRGSHQPRMNRVPPCRSGQADAARSAEAGDTGDAVDRDRRPPAPAH